MGGPAPVNPQGPISGGEQLSAYQQGQNIGVTAPTQQAYNIGSQAGSLPNESNQYGSVNYQQTGTGPNGVPIYTQKTTLSPIEQKLFGLQTGAQTKGGQAANALLAGANYGAQDPSTVIGNMTQGRVAQNLNEQVSALQPYFDLQSRNARDQLAAQGITAATNPTAYNAGMLPIETGQQSTVANFLSSQEPTVWGQQLQAYNDPAALATQLTPQAQSPTSIQNNMPQLGQTQVQPINVNAGAGALAPVYTSQAQQQQAQYNALIAALGGLGGAGISAFG